jgi:BASS family bile acid:Na+ symporter
LVGKGTDKFRNFAAPKKNWTLMQKIRSYILPIAIVLGLLLHEYCASFSVAVPYLIFSILLLTFSAVDVRKLRFSPMFVWILLFQVVVSIGVYGLMKALGSSDVLAEGVMMASLCPVAASVAVVSCMLGADRQTVTSFSIIGNLVMSIVAPAYFTLIGVQPEMTFMASFLSILKRVGVVIGLPFFVALALQLWLPKANNFLSRYKGLSFYLWSIALLFTIGQTIDFIFLHGKGNWNVIIWLAVASLLFCALQFALGKWIGRKYGDVIAGGQLLGQKNTAMGIWMANHYLHPLASVYLAFYSVLQNLFNSWQIWYYGRKKG